VKVLVIAIVIIVCFVPCPCLALWEGYDDTDNSDIDIVERSGNDITYYEYRSRDKREATVTWVTDGGYTVHVKDKDDGEEHKFYMDDYFE